MLVVTAGSQRWENKSYDITVRFCEKKCKEFGYKFQAYDLGGLGFGTFVDDPRNGHERKNFRYAIKPELILRSLKEAEEGELVAWIDGDATLINRIDEIEADNSFDVGINIRMRRARRKHVNTNAGVLFFRNNEASRRLVQDWINLMGPTPWDDPDKAKGRYCDQTILEAEIMRAPGAIEGSLYDHVGEVHMVNGARVKLFECRYYNNWWIHRDDRTLDPIPVADKSMLSPEIKILHFKSHRYPADRLIRWEGEEMSILDMYGRVGSKE